MPALPGQVALVTGAGIRVGRAIALALGSRRMRVVVHYNGSEVEARETARLVDGAGGTATLSKADLTSVAECERLIDEVVAEQGALDVLVNSAAMMLRTPVGDVTEKDWDAMHALNARAPFFLTQRAAPALRRSRGCVVNIADMAAFETWTGYIPHGMTKAEVVQMTRGLAHALAPEVRVNAIAPGVVMLPDGFDPVAAEHLRLTTPVQRFGSAEDVAQAVLYLINADFVTGEVIRVDGGRHIRR